MIALGASLALASLAAGRRSDPPAAPQPSPIIRSRLISEQVALIPGKTERLALALEIASGWHTYWNGTNDTGVPIMITVTVPEGFEALPVEWPAPKRHISPGDLLDHVYEGRTTLVIPIRVPADAKVGESVTITVAAEWLVCQSACVPEDATHTITLPIKPASYRTSDAPLIDEARIRLPHPPQEPTDPRMQLVWKSDAVTIRWPGSKWMAFYPQEHCTTLENPIRDAQAKGESLTLRFADAPSSIRLHGVLESRLHSPEGGFAMFVQFDMIHPAPTPGATGAEPTGAGASGP